eukprot:SAG11_NODE_152_length_14520_cov_49.681575_5_plen_261_part_00
MGCSASCHASAYEVLDGDEKNNTRTVKSARPAQSQSPAASAPSTPSGSSNRSSQTEHPFQALLKAESQLLLGNLRKVECDIIRQENKNTRLGAAKKRLHEAIGAVEATESLWPGSMDEFVHSKATYGFAKAKLYANAAELAARVSLLAASARRHSSFRRRIIGIEHALTFLEELAELAEKDSINSFATWTDSKTRMQRSVRTEVRSAETVMMDLRDSMIEKRQAKEKNLAALGAWEFAQKPANWAVSEIAVTRLVHDTNH